MASFRSLLAVSFSSLVLGLLGACGNGGEEGDGGSKARILEFAADPETVVEGDTTTLRWSTRNAVSVILLEDGINRVGGRLPTEGSVVVTPARDSFYRLEAHDAEGGIAEASLEVGVEPFGLPRIESFVASPGVVSRGNPVTLSWEVLHADSVELVSELGGRIALFAPAERRGAYAVQPNDSTKYVLRARNASGVVAEEVEVIVGRRPTVSLELSTTNATFGDELELRWTVTGAETLVVYDVDGKALHEGAAIDGSLAITASRSGMIRAVAQGFGGEEVSEVRVEVKPLIEDFRVQIHSDARPGSPALAIWKVQGAERVVVSDGLEDLLQSYAEEGTADVKIGTAGFFLRAYSGSVAATKSAVVQVVEKPLIRKISTGPLVTAGQGIVGMSPIGWEIDGAARIQLEVDPGGIVDTGSKSPRMDEVNVLFTAPGTVTLTAFNGAGSTKVVIPSPVDPVPTIADFFAAPSRTGLGEFVEIHWDTISAASVVLEREGTELNVEPTLVSGKHSTEAPITGATSFVLRVKNSLGHEVISEPLVVDTGPPNQLHFGTEDGQLMFRVDTRVRLVWKNDGGTSLTVENTRTGDIECTENDWALIRDGGCYIDMPPEQEEIPLLLTVTNGDGSDSRTLDIQAVTGPIILHFDTPETDEITEGDALLFSWETLPDAEENFPTLSLVDDRGVEYDLSDVTGENALMGAKRFRVHDWGAEPRVFTLTATSAVPPAYSLSTEVMVYGIPTVDAIAASPTFAEKEGDVVSFISSTTHATNVELYLLDKDGTPAETPFFSTLDPDDAQQCLTPAPREMNCTTQVKPTIAKPNVRLVAINPLGVETDADLRIGVDPATISSFTVNGIEAPATIEILAGQEVTIAWDTLRSTGARLHEHFFDISQSPTATDFNLYTSGDSGLVNLDFPEGFTFPYDGEVFDAARVTVDGILSFDLALTTNCCNPLLPSTSDNNKRVDLMPFWDDQITNRTQPGGTIHWDYLPFHDLLIVQWTDMQLYSTSYNPSSLNYQLVLFPDGRFEYRYGVMTSVNASQGRGVGASIGTQNRAGTAVNYFSHNQEIPGGIEGRVLRYNAWDELDTAHMAPLNDPLSGSFSFTPAFTTGFSLHAWNGHSEHIQDIEIIVHPKGELEVWTEPAEPVPGELVVLHWSGSNVTSLSVYDGADNLLHSTASGASGSFSLGHLPQGFHDYTVRAEGMVPIDQIEVPLAVSVHSPFSLDAFAASETLLKLDDPPAPVTLSWLTTNATSAKITAQPGGVVTEIPASDLASGEMVVHPDRTTTYEIEVESHGRFRRDTVEVEVRRVWIDEFNSSASVITEGQSVVLDWVGSVDGTVSLTPPMGLVEGGSAFQDISSVGTSAFGTNADAGVTNVVFPAGFTFPYFGETYDRIYFAIDGYASFDSGLTTVYTNEDLPATSVANQRMHLPIFWDDLHTGTNGAVHTAFLTNPDRFVIQWTNFHRYAPFSNRTWDLNFQIVLFADGSFEYRYGTMSPPPTGSTSTSDCNPLSCVEEAMGSSATIGLQIPGGLGGNAIHFGGPSSSNYPPFPGGLENRSFRFDATMPNTGSVTVSPSKTTTYQLCIEDAHWKECEDLVVIVVKPGDLQITEVMPVPTTGGAEWVEIRNFMGLPIDLEGFELGIGPLGIEIASSLVVPSGGYAVLANANDTALQPDLVLAGATLGGATGSLSLRRQGTVIHTISWSGATTGASQQLRGDLQKLGKASATASELCAASVSYDGGPSMGSPGAISDCSLHGYIVDNYSDQPFIDIRPTGTIVPSLNVDTATYTIPGGIGFSMPFFTASVTDLWVSSNALIGFGGTPTTSISNRDLTTTATQTMGIVAAFWDDLTVADNSAHSAFHWERRTIAGRDVTILQWSRYKRYGQSGEVTVQAQLWDNGDIVIAFGHIEGNDYYFGGDANVGIEAVSGSPEIQFLYNQPILRAHQVLYYMKQ